VELVNQSLPPIHHNRLGRGTRRDMDRKAGMGLGKAQEGKYQYENSPGE
jgi:hypothetical protein